MREHLLAHNAKTKSEEFVLVFRPGDEVLSGLQKFAQRRNIRDAHFTAIGAVSSAVIGWYDNKYHAYRTHHVNEQCEVTSLIGNISEFKGKVAIHAHVNLGLENGMVMGGHALELFVWPTVELFVQTNAVPLRKAVEPGTGLPTLV